MPPAPLRLAAAIPQSGAATVSSGAAAVIGVTAGVAAAVMVRLSLSDNEIHWQRVPEAVVPIAALLGAWAVIRRRYPAGSLS